MHTPTQGSTCQRISLSDEALSVRSCCIWACTSSSYTDAHAHTIARAAHVSTFWKATRLCSVQRGACAHARARHLVMHFLELHTQMHQALHFLELLTQGRLSTDKLKAGRHSCIKGV
eukprot:1150373-Pelagomonas_calceolata.AAC.6